MLFVNAFFDNYCGSIFDNLDRVDNYLEKQEKTKLREVKYVNL